jgi:hypothetical protein
LRCCAISKKNTRPRVVKFGTVENRGCARSVDSKSITTDMTNI